MTVCVAAFASDFRAVVCVADKALSYQDYIQWDSDSSKMVTLNPSGVVVMFAGGERDTSEMVARLLAIEDRLGDDRREIKKECEGQAKAAIDEFVTKLYLAPRQLTKADYLAAISGPQINPYIKLIANEIHEFRLDCSMLLCGTDKKGNFILWLDHQGVVTDMSNTGFHAIGSGWEKAVSQLLFSEHKRDHNIGRVLYDAFDAKAHAELAVGVGYEWDAKVVLGGRLGTHDVPKEIKEDLIEKAWGKHSRSPFEKWNAKEYEKGPPRDWKKRLDAFSKSIMVKGHMKKSSPPPPQTNF